MGAADGSVFTRQRVPVGLHQVSYLTGGREGDMEPVLYLHGLGEEANGSLIIWRWAQPL